MPKKSTPAKKQARAAKPMSDAHKAALALGRDQGRAVRRYLDALEQNRPRRGRKRTRESVERRLQDVESRLAEAEPMDRLHLIQERLDLQAELASMAGNGVDMSALEEAFVEAAAEYGSRRGLGYAAWREAGVPPAVLRRAGITRS
jgi:serine phosphatase RsbU (regulator of sigma subunit)